MIFTKDELKKLDRENLKDLASYLDIEFDPRIKTDKLIDMILVVMTPPPPPDPTPRYSVRVKRIMEMKEKGEL